MCIMIICHWAILHYNMSFQTIIAGRSDGVFWWFPALSEDQDFFFFYSPKLSCGFKVHLYFNITWFLVRKHALTVMVTKWKWEWKFIITIFLQMLNMSGPVESLSHLILIELATLHFYDAFLFGTRLENGSDVSKCVMEYILWSVVCKIFSCQ